MGGHLAHAGLVVCAAVAWQGCVFSADYGQSAFRCDDGLCPDGLVCDPADSVCRPDVDTSDAAPAGDDDAGDVEAGPIPGQTAVAIEVAPFSTTSTTFVAVDGAQLTLDTQPGQTWFVWFSATLGGSSTAGIAAQLRYTVDGVVTGQGGTQNTTANEAGAWQHVHAFEASGGPVVVEVEASNAIGSTTEVSSLRVVAFSLTAVADPHVMTAQPVAVPKGEFAPQRTLSFSPSAPGRYLIYALLTLSEQPGATNVGARWRALGDVWPESIGTPDTSAAHLCNSRASTQTALVVRAVDLPTTDPAELVLETISDAAEGGTVADVRAGAFRIDGLRSYSGQEDAGNFAIEALGDETVSSIEVSLASPQDVVVIQNALAWSLDAPRALSFTVGAQTDAVVHAIDNSAYRATYGSVWLLPQTSSIAAEIRGSVVAATGQLNVRERAVHVLGF